MGLIPSRAWLNLFPVWLEFSIRRGRAVNETITLPALPKDRSATLTAIDMVYPSALADARRVVRRLEVCLSFGDAPVLRCPATVLGGGTFGPLRVAPAGIGLKWHDAPVSLGVKSLRRVWPARKFRMMIVLRGVME